MSNFDHQFSLAINAVAGRWHWLDIVGIFLAVYGIYILMGSAFLLAVFRIHQKHFAIAFFSSVISNYGIVKVIKFVVNRPRPFEVLPVHQLVPDYGSGHAFASGHAAIMFSIAFSFYGTKYFWPFVIWAALCSIARVFVGVHYLGDVLASIALSGLMVYTLRRLFKIHILS